MALFTDHQNGNKEVQYNGSKASNLSALFYIIPKQKAVRVAQLEQKLTTFEELFNEATPEERKDLLRLHINHQIYTPDAIQLALFDSANETERIKVQREDVVGCPSGIRTPIPGTKIQCLAIRRRGNTMSRS